MNIAVIAANGRSGQAFVAAALAGGHKVRAGIFGRDTLPDNPGLTKYTCNATNETQVRALIEGQDAVVSLIGHVKLSPPSVQTDAMHTVVSCMEGAGIARLISLTGTGVRFPGDHITLVDRILNTAIAIIDPLRIKDGISHVEVLKKSKLDWTVIRVLKLQNVAPSRYALHANGPTKLYVSREDVANAILEVLEHKTFVKQAPIIGS